MSYQISGSRLGYVWVVVYMLGLGFKLSFTSFSWGYMVFEECEYCKFDTVSTCKWKKKSVNHLALVLTVMAWNTSRCLF